MTLFMTINHNLTHALVALEHELSEAPTIVKDTSYTKQEKFLEVQAHACQLITLTKGK
jgi:hypothetical protein